MSVGVERESYIAWGVVQVQELCINHDWTIYKFPLKLKIFIKTSYLFNVEAI